MVRQERAEQTRRRLVEAAAVEFDQHGYTRTSLSRVSRSAGVTMGALTFHFPTKGALADVVCESGVNAVRWAVHRLRPAPSGGPAAVAELTRELGRLLEEETAVRAAVRLAQDDPGEFPDWRAAWLPTLRALLADLTGDPPDPGRLAELEKLVVYLLIGAYNDARAPGPRPRLREELDRLWRLAFHGVDDALRLAGSCHSRSAYGRP
ncbi:MULTISPECIES: TetR/AcrR family transcriptional regulator [Streptomyces]|uniref:TetR family transcriptional regulator n=1 Tax=Streptomyces lichenis TaxID=2306967 RepID=A0ABT0I3V8_9ACTN|nr:TetR/AcrR family transcriptional regulator [Streptomyces lichenis]MCK8676013.1 TetR family transcriptional regulator [Streptomyces lichenis]